MKPNKTIFFLLGSFKVGGVERVASLVGENLIRSGYDVKILLLKDTIDLPVDHLKEHIINLNTQNYNNRIIKILVSYYGLWKYYFKYRPYRIISFSSGLNILLFFTMLPNQVFRIDTNLFWVKSKLYRRRILKIIGFLPNIKKVITPSHELRLRFKPYVPENSYKKFITIHNPLSFQPFKNESLPEDINKPYLVSVGRLDKHKGFEQLIRCFSVANFKTNFFLYIIGSGPMEQDLKIIIKELGMEHRVKLLGFKKYPQPLISNAEGLILNSTFESFGNVIVEALSLGVPVISNDCDFGPREIIQNGINGLLYDQSEDENLIKILEEFVNSDSLRSQLKKNTSHKMDRFDSEKITKEWIEKILQ